jgi:hypothetical protein
LIPNAFESKEGFIVNLRNSFEISARNGGSMILELKIIHRASGRVMYRKQIDEFGVIKIKN